MFCPTCEAEYREGFIRCTDCNVALVRALPVRFPRAVSAPASEIELFRSLDHLDTEMVAGALAEAGISSTLRTQMAGGLQLVGIESHWAPGQWRVLYVPAVAEEEAKEVLSDIRGGPPLLHAVENEPFDAGFVARRKRAIGLFVLAPFLAGFAMAVLRLIRELSR
jgi:hypothetical protein